MKVKTLFQRHRLETGGGATERYRFAAAITPEEILQSAFEVSLLRPIVAADGRDLTRVNLATSAETFPVGGLTSYVDHREDGAGGIIGRRSSREAVGLVHSVRADGDAIRGRYEFLSNGAALDLRAVAEEIVRRRQAGRPVPNIGLSPDAYFAVVDGHLAHVEQWLSVDVVSDPATGAGFEDLVREALANRERQPIVYDLNRQPLAAAPGGMGMMQIPCNYEAGGNRQNMATDPDLRQQLALQATEIRELRLAELRRVTAEESELVRRDVEDWLSERQRLNAALPSVSDAQAYAAVRRERYGQSPVRGNGIAYASSEPDGHLRLVLATADLFGANRERFVRARGLSVPANVGTIPVEPLQGINELYVILTGDKQGEQRFFPERVRLANVTTSTFSYFVQDAVNVLIEDTLDDDALGVNWYESIISRQSTPNILDVNWVRLDSFDTAPTVAEGAAYLELAWDDTEETATYLKKGGYIGITLETFLKDRTRRIVGLAQGIVSSARKAESGLVTSVFTTATGAGPTMTETSRALMNTTDVNYGTTAFAVAEFWVVSDAMAARKAAGDASWNLGRMNRPNRLVVPYTLVQEANEVVNSVLRPQESGGATQSGNIQTTNVIRAVHPDLSIVECPEFTDATNWYAVSHRPPLHPAIVLFTLRGQERPQVFLQDAETAGSMFTNDEIRLKVRHWCVAMPTNNRQFYGEVVAG